MHVADPEAFRERWYASIIQAMPFAAPPQPGAAEPPRPLRPELSPPDAFPLSALGDVLGAAAKAIHDKVQAPIAVCAQSVLAAATLAVQARADIQLPTGQARPISGYFITVAGSGERKTSADREALWPISRHEQNLRELYDAELPGSLNARDAWDKQRVQILGDKRKYPDPATKRSALQLLDWLLTWDHELISLPDVYQLGPNAFRDAKTAREAIYLLQEHGWLEPVEGGAFVNGVRRLEVWRIIG